MENNSSFSDERLKAIKKKFSVDEEDSIPRITLYSLKQLCKQYNLLQTLELNDKMYLHHQGFRKIENMNYLPEVMTLWLQGNRITVIENLTPCRKLRSLFVFLIITDYYHSFPFIFLYRYLQNNCIEVIKGLDDLLELTTLVLSGNQIRKVENLQNNKNLQTLNLSQNLFVNNILFYYYCIYSILFF